MAAPAFCPTSLSQCVGVTPGRGERQTLGGAAAAAIVHPTGPVTRAGALVLLAVLRTACESPGCRCFLVPYAMGMERQRRALHDDVAQPALY